MRNFSVTVVGIDLAAEPKGTAVAVLHGSEVVHLQIGARDVDVVELCRGADKIGIDCPLGWPNAFIDFVTAHRDGHPVTAAGTIAQREPLVYRQTDLYVRAPGLRPLSVSADRIGHAAFRAAALLPRLGAGTDRSGDSRVVETYPAGSLHRWGMRWKGYKTGAGTILADLADEVRTRAGLVLSGERRRLFETSDHAFDAVVAALSARAAALGRVDPIPPEHADAARVEGWIRLPTGPLENLANPLE
ncbi:MAG: DUF429 domain-containing protein [Jatrophihabitans sp.]